MRARTRRGVGRLRAAVVVLAGLAVVVGLAPAASAGYAVEPVGPSWVPNGGVHAVVVDEAAGRVYVGGAFTGNVAALNASTGALIWLGNANGDVRALALGPNGSLLMGGAFSAVGGETHRKIASVNAATGAVNSGFKGSVGGTVRDIVVVGNTAYFGGAFTNHSGVTQRGLGAIDATTGKRVTAFTTAANDGTVYALATDGATLFIAGNFTGVGGQARNQQASVALASHTLNAWNPARACTGCNVIWDLTVRGDRVYTAGRNAGGLYIVHKATGAVVHKLGGFNGDTQAVTVAPDGRLYLGGHFVTVGGVARELVAEFDVSGAKPVLKEFSANFVTSWPGVWAMATTAGRLYVAGDFTQAGTQKKYPYFAMFPSAGATDTAPPTVTSRTPAANATGVAVNTDVTATFSEPVTGVSSTTFTLAPAAGGTAVNATVSQGTGNQWILNPAADLAAGTQYTAALTNGIRDGANNSLAATSWSFTTAAPATDTTPPTVASTDPGSGSNTATVATNVTATFSEPVTGVSGANFTLASAAGAAVTASVRQGTGNAWILDPAADLAAGTQYTARLGAGITDGAGNAFAGHTWTFTTAAASSDTTPPTWTGRIPSANGATGISTTTNVTVAFSETVTNVTTTTFTLRPTSGGSNVAAGVYFNSTSGRWVLNPTSSLAANTQYTATMSNAVTDLAGNPFAGMSWSFTTGA